MRNFKSDNRSRGRNDSPRKNFGGGDSRKFSLHDAVCDKCGKNCQVPFRPSGDRPIFCSECFERKDGGGDRNRFNRNDSRGGRNSDNRGANRPPQQSNMADQAISRLVEKIATLNTRLDTIIDLLSSTRQKKLDSTEKKTEKKVKKIKKPKSKKADKVTKEKKKTKNKLKSKKSSK